MNNIFKTLSSIAVVAILSISIPVFAGPTPGPINCNPNQIGFLSTAALSLDSTTETTAQFDFAGKAGDDVACIYTMNIYLANTANVSPSLFSLVHKAGNLKFVGQYNYQNEVITGLSSGTTYYAIGCVTGTTASFKCSTPVQFTTAQTPNNGGSGGGGSGGGIYQLPPTVGSVSVNNSGNNNVFASVEIQTLGCSAETWFEYGKNNFASRTSPQIMNATLSGILSGTISGLSGGSQYTIRAAARNCVSGIVYGPSSTFLTTGNYTTGSNINSQNNSNMSTSTHYNSSATNTVNHSGSGYWASNDPTEGQYIDENEYYNSTVGNTTSYIDENYSTYSYVVNDANGGIYRANANVDYYGNYYRGNGGDLRVFDRPFDIVAASVGTRGGVARTYDNYYWGASTGITLLMIVVVALFAFGAYRLGTRSAN